MIISYRRLLEEFLVALWLLLRLTICSDKEFLLFDFDNLVNRFAMKVEKESKGKGIVANVARDVTGINETNCCDVIGTWSHVRLKFARLKVVELLFQTSFDHRNVEIVSTGDLPVDGVHVFLQVRDFTCLELTRFAAKNSDKAFHCLNHFCCRRWWFDDE